MTELITNRPRMIALTIDCNDLDTMTAFWSQLLGVEVQGVQEPFAFLSRPEGTGISVWLQHVPESPPAKTRIHLDFAAIDLDAAIAHVVEIGGTVGGTHEWEGHTWRQCFDPEGNVFDIMQAAQ